MHVYILNVSVMITFLLTFGVRRWELWFCSLEASVEFDKK